MLLALTCLCLTEPELTVADLYANVLQTAAARGDDDNDAVDTEDMQQASFAHSGMCSLPR